MWSTLFIVHLFLKANTTWFCFNRYQLKCRSLKIVKKKMVSKIICCTVNPLPVIDEYTRIINSICLWSWTPRTTPRSSATHAPGSGLISIDAKSPKNSTFHQNWMPIKGKIKSPSSPPLSY